MRDRWPRLFAVALVVSFLFVPHTSRAQVGLGHLEDASTSPRGLLRVRAITAFTRYDSRFTTTGTEPLGAPFTADSLGTRQLMALSAIQTLVQSATASPFTLTLGRWTTNATAREEVVPVALEYGITDRLAVGVVIPVVRKRAAVLVQHDTNGMANVGPNPGRTSTTAAQNNVQVQAEFANAVSQLQARLSACQANPSGPGCAAVVGREAEAMQLIQSSQSFAATMASLYGGSTENGLAFVPISQSAAQLAIAMRISDFNTQYRSLLSSGVDLLRAVPTPAGGPVGPAELQRYLTSDLGLDSLVNREWVGIGDVEFGLKLLVLDRPRTEQRNSAIQFAVASSVRLPTGSRLSPSPLVDLRIGEGSTVVDVRAFLDARLARLGVLAAGHFAAATGAATPTLPAPITGAAPFGAKDSRWTDIHVAPRWHFSEPFAIHGAYSLRSTDQSGSNQLVGGGVSFSTLSTYRAGGRTLPMEMRFTHLEAISGDAGKPKFFRDQIEVRIYFRLGRR